MSASRIANFDKLQHFILGLGASVLSLAVLHLVFGIQGAWLRVLVLAPAAFVGGVKELLDYHDPKHHTCDAMDALMTLLGGMVVTVLLP